MKQKYLSWMLLAALVFSGCTPAVNETTGTTAVPVVEHPSETTQPEEETTIPETTLAPTEPTAPASEPVPTTVPETTAPVGSEPKETEPTTVQTQPSATQTTEPEETVPTTQPRETEPPAPPTTEATQPSAPTSGDIYDAAQAMAVGNSYAASTYGMQVDYSLGFSNASYEFADTAYVSGLNRLGGQSFLDTMVRQKVDSLTENLRGAYGADIDLSAYRVNCYVEYDPDGDLYWIYVFYG